MSALTETARPLLRMRARWLLQISLVTLTCTALLPRDGSTQTQRSGPEAVAKSFFAAIAAERWRDAASLLDLESFDEYRNAMASNARSALPASNLTAEMLMKQDTAMPRVVAEYQIKQINRFRRDSTGTIRRTFAGVTSPGQLRSLTALEAASRMLEAQDIRYQIRLSANGLEKTCADSVLKSLPLMSVAPNAVLGTVVVRDSVAYVLHELGAITVRGEPDHPDRPRMGDRWAGNLFSSSPALLKLRKVHGRWLIEAGPEGSDGLGLSTGFGFDCQPRK